MNTICAISTAPGVGGIGIIRISGKDAVNILKKLFISTKNIEDIKSHTINYGYIINPKNNQKIDEVLVSIMKAPKTYTKEDVVEINCHGGIVAVKKILEICIEAGGRLAEPGEFTKRAFLNGRIDLTQAEAVIDIINSKTDLGLEKAFDQLEGSLSYKIKKFKNQVLSLMAHIEAVIDFPEHDIEDATTSTLKSQITKLIDDMDKLLKDAQKGKIIREGLNTVIVGKPNVGKSSLLNILLRENRAIVTEVPGTTRDIIEEYINIGGIPLKIIDTAGIRKTEDVVEKIGVQKTKEAIEKADLIIFVIDNSTALTQEDLGIAKSIKSKKVMVIINKIDLQQKTDSKIIKDLFPDKEIIRVSVKEKISLEKIEKAIENMFFEGLLNISDTTLITNIRHKNLLQKAYESLQEANKGIDCGMPLDCISIDLKSCLESLGAITGDNVNEEIIDEIFSRFCLGK